MKNKKLIYLYIILFNIIIITKIISINNKYEDQYNKIINNYISLPNNLRGRILDKNGNVLVDNQTINSLYVKKEKNTDISKLINTLINNISFNKVDDYNYLYQKIINATNNEEIKIKDNISNDEMLIINDLNINELSIKTTYKRIYNYDTCLNSIFGSIGYITIDNKEYYLNKGYQLNDIVGISYLEEYYDEYLRGKKAIYKVNEDGSKELISKEEKGNDLVLNIDINIQLKLENYLKQEILNAKKYISSKYYKGTYIVVSDTNTGGIIAMVGLNYDNNIFKSDVIGILNNSYTVGSVVKGATQSVAYINGVLDENTKVLDGCIKLKFQPEKCSWKRLGYLNDLDALTYSSNYFQFNNVFNVLGIIYYPNIEFNVTEANFNTYRHVLKQYGLGSSTKIDLYNENLGLTGKQISGDLLLNLSIGQYDTYTPLMLNQYIQTIANNGNRLKLRIADYIIDNNSNKININPIEILNKVNIENKYMKRIQLGLYNAIEKGTGISYKDKVSMAGKTGTSETYYNGISTTTRSFVAYMPYDQPKYAISIVSPNLSYKNSQNNTSSPINTKISRYLSNILFEN